DQYEPEQNRSHGASPPASACHEMPGHVRLPPDRVSASPVAALCSSRAALNVSTRRTPPGGHAGTPPVGYRRAAPACGRHSAVSTSAREDGNGARSFSWSGLYLWDPNFCPRSCRGAHVPPALPPAGAAARGLRGGCAWCYVLQRSTSHQTLTPQP